MRARSVAQPVRSAQAAPLWLPPSVVCLQAAAAQRKASLAARWQMAFVAALQVVQLGGQLQVEVVRRQTGAADRHQTMAEVDALRQLDLLLQDGRSVGRLQVAEAGLVRWRVAQRSVDHQEAEEAAGDHTSRALSTDRIDRQSRRLAVIEEGSAAAPTCSYLQVVHSPKPCA